MFSVHAHNDFNLLPIEHIEDVLSVWWSTICLKHLIDFLILKQINKAQINMGCFGVKCIVNIDILEIRIVFKLCKITGGKV